MRCFDDNTATVLEAVARAGMVSADGPRPAAQIADAVRSLDRLFASLGGKWGRGFASLAKGLQVVSAATTGRRFTRLSLAGQQRLLERLHRGAWPGRLLGRALLAPLRAAHYDSAVAHELAGVRHGVEAPWASDPERWRQNMLDLDTMGAGEEVEAEVVVVGTGAGGAVVAAELAQQGVAVVLLEEGGYHDRRDFDGRPLQLQAKLYRDMGATTAVGNCWIPVAMGRCVGGSTTVNNGTCYRAPERVLHKWRGEHGLEGLEESALEDAYQRVERSLGVERAAERYLGGVAQVIARGCDALGIREHGALRRNAADCDGQGLCCWGCPTDAKRSTNVSYVPRALRSGAMLFTHARAEQILVDGGGLRGAKGRERRVWGVRAVSPSGKQLIVRADAVVISAGAVMTPLLLLRHDLANRSGEVGKNLSLHPAAAVAGLFTESLGGARGIPQGYGVEAFHDEGLLFEGAFVPLPIYAAGLPLVDARHSAAMEAYERTALFGFMVEDSSRGRVRAGPGGRPLLSYWLNGNDVARLKRGLEILFRIYLAAGAEAVYPSVAGFDAIHGPSDIGRFRDAKIRARDLELTAYHPLGTARMGRDPSTSVVDEHHESHDIQGLFVVDGSAVPSSIGVNPQLTIMALATRAATFVAERALEPSNAGLPAAA